MRSIHWQNPSEEKAERERERSYETCLYQFHSLGLYSEFEAEMHLFLLPTSRYAYACVQCASGRT